MNFLRAIALLATGLCLADGAVRELDGFVHVYGECPDYTMTNYVGHTLDTCVNTCNSQKQCASFLWMEPGTTHTTLAKRGGCLISIRQCDKKEFINHDADHHTYIRLGHRGLEMPGYISYPGECPGVKYTDIGANINQDTCADKCDKAPACRSFFLSPARYCKLSDGDCDAKRLQKTVGYTFVREERDIAFWKTTSSHSALKAASYAVDGYRSSFLKQESCFQSYKNVVNPWFMVTLGGYHAVKKVKITNRDDCCSDQLTDFTIKIRDAKRTPQDIVCADVDTTFVGTKTFTCEEPILGTDVRVDMNDMGMFRELTLCEVEVYDDNKMNAIDQYEEIKNTYCNYHSVRDLHYTSSLEECARICNEISDCGAFYRYSTTQCYFVYYGCEENTRTAHTSYNLYLRLNHPQMEIPGYRHFQGGCKGFKFDLNKNYNYISLRDCAKKCNKQENCETFQWTGNGSPRSGYCQLSSAMMCDEPYNQGGPYHMYSRDLVNFALGKKAYQSTTFGINVASKATDGVAGRTISSRSCSITKSSQTNWLAVDLEFNTRVKKVYVDAPKGGELSNVKIIVTNVKPRPGHELEYVKNEICDEYTGAATKNAKFQCSSAMNGRYVVVLQEGLKVAAPLIVCEIVVIGYKDFYVHGYTENDGQCNQFDIETKKDLTPGDCADVCSATTQCAAFVWWEDTSEVYNCVTKASNCDGKLKQTANKPPFRTYVKDGHPGLTIAGFTKEEGYYHTGYSLKTLYYMKDATPANCGLICNQLDKCFGVTFHWGTYPTCYIQSEWPATLKLTAHDNYFTFKKEEPNVGLNRATYGEGQYTGGAVDGNIDGTVSHQSCFVSSPKDGKSWWALDFEKPHYVNSIKIWNRQDCCEQQLKQLVVIVSDNKPPVDHDPTEICAEYEKPTTGKGKILKLNCRHPIAGRYLIIKKEGNEPLVLCEVLVNGQLSTDQNVALKKVTDSSSTLGQSLSTLAVDGKLNTNVGADFCAATRASKDKDTTWWSVDLGSTHVISVITIHTRSDCCTRSLADFTVSVSSSKPRWNFAPEELDICNEKKGAVALNTTWSVRCRNPPIGQYVIVSQSNDGDSLTVCEVQVFGKQMKLNEPIGFWPLTGGLKGKDVTTGETDGEIRNFISRPGPLLQPYTALTFSPGQMAGLHIPASKKIAFKTSFTIMAYIFQSTSVTDGSVIEWESGDLKLHLKNEKLVLTANGQMDNHDVTSKENVKPDKWQFVAATFDSTSGNIRVFIDDEETEKNVGTKFRLSPVSMDDVKVAFNGYKGGMSCLQIYSDPMVLAELIGARSRCKHYLKQPGDRAVNVVKGMKATQSSTWQDAKADLAIDGDDAPFMWRKSCSSTQPDTLTKLGPAWWAVNLQTMRLITSVKVTNRMDCCADRLRDFRILVTTDKPANPIGYDSVDVCAYQAAALKPGQSQTFTCREGGLVGQYVIITKPDNTPLTLCEVEAYGDPVKPQPKRDQLFIWTIRRIESLRRVEKKLVNEVANLKLCKRACLAESSFECLSIEYEYNKKRCRLYEEKRTIRVDNSAKNAALDGTFVSQTTAQNQPAAETKSNKDLMNDIELLRAALQKVEKTRDLLTKTSQTSSRAFELVVHRIEVYKKQLAQLTSGTPKTKPNSEGRNDLEQVSKSPLIYSEWGSHDPTKTHPKCTSPKIQRWQSSTNWILDVASDKVINGVRRADQCEEMCLAEINFFCLSYAYNVELGTCSLWSTNSAQPGLRLIQKSGYTYHQWGCGRKPEMCECYGSGDPHYRSFNGQTKDHMGMCKYLAVKPINDGGICDFKVEQKNTGPGVSWVTLTDVKIFGHTVRFYRSNTLTIDGRVYTDMTEANRIHQHMQITMTTLSVDRCQLYVHASLGQLVIKVGKDYWSNRVEGWCGNCGGSGSTFDFVKYEVVDDSGLGYGSGCQTAIAPTTPCKGDWATKIKQPQYCGYFTDRSGPFGECIAHGPVKANDLYKNCQFDVCEMAEVSEGSARQEACQALSQLAEECANFQKPIKEWRNAEFCPLPCDKNMIYSVSISGCPATCADPDAPTKCDMSPREGCMCKPGYVLNEKRSCVVKELCKPNSLADIVFLIDMSELMGPKLASSAKDLVADIVDTIDISPTTTQVSVIPYCFAPWHTLLYTDYPDNRNELVEAIRNLPFCDSVSRLPLGFKYVKEKILTAELEKRRPSDQFMKFIVIITNSDIAQDDAVVEEAQAVLRNYGKVLWIKYGSQSVPDPKGLTIPEYVLMITDEPDKKEEIVDSFYVRVFKETKCGQGYYNKETKTDESCKDIDECRMDVCSAGSTCENTKGGYRCVCPSGFCFKPNYGCEEINECYRNPCLPGSTCNNTMGAYDCLCPSGFRYDTKRSCVDINECTEKNEACKKGSQCINNDGGYNCECPKGLVYKEDVGCEVTDICLVKKPCKGIATCNNVHKSFKCSCPRGYNSDGENGCTKIDLCAKKPCKGDTSTCRMVDEKYLCLCPENFEYIEHAGCQRIDPCLAKPCKGYAECTSDDGVFYCGCPGEMYYNETVGCEEPELRTPSTKLVVFLDDSDAVGEKEFRILTASVTKLALTMADNNKNLALGVILMAGKPKLAFPVRDRPVYDYDELIQDLRYDGGALNFQGALQLVHTMPELIQKNAGEFIISVITNKNMVFSELLEGTCAKIKQASGAKCHYMALLYGSHREILDPKASFILVVPSVVELFTIDLYVKSLTASWLSCPVGFVHTGSKCRQMETVIYTCPFEGEFYSAESVWISNCITYKCLPEGAKAINAECMDVRGGCHKANGRHKYRCLKEKKIYDECTCTIELSADGSLTYSLQIRAEFISVRRVVKTIKGTADGASCYFPFRYRDSIYHDCTDDQSDIPWCSTTADLDADGLWGYCVAEKDQGKCLFDNKEYLEGQNDYVADQCLLRTCMKDGLMKETRNECRTLDKRCVPLGSRDYVCDINGYRYETCFCVGEPGRVNNVAYTYVETVGTKTIGKETCVFDGKQYEMGKAFSSGCDRYKCEEGKTMDLSKQVAYAKPVWIDGDCEHLDPDGVRVCIPVNKTIACTKNAQGKGIDCSCTRDEEGMFLLNIQGMAQRKR